MKKKLIFLLCLLLAVLPTLHAAAEELNEDFVAEAEKTDEPLLFLPTVYPNKDDLFYVTLAASNITGLTSADLVIQYNPYRLQYQGYSVDDTLSSGSGLILTGTEKAGPDILDKYGNPAHEVYISLAHMERLAADFDTTNIVRIAFLAIGGGDCPLELTAMSFQIDGKEVTPKIVQGMAVIGGEEASDWDYSAITTANIAVPQGSFALLEEPTGLSTPVKIVIVAVILIAILIVAVFVFGGKNRIIDEEEPEDEEPEEEGSIEEKPAKENPVKEEKQKPTPPAQKENAEDKKKK